MNESPRLQLSPMTVPPRIAYAAIGFMAGIGLTCYRTHGEGTLGLGWNCWTIDLIRKRAVKRLPGWVDGW